MTTIKQRVPKPKARREAGAFEVAHGAKRERTKKAGKSVLLRKVAEARLVHRFLVKGGIVDVEGVAGSLGMSMSQLAETIGVRRETFYKKARSEAPKTQTRLREMLEVLNRVSAWAGGELQAMAWYRSEPIPAFGGRTPESLVKTGEATALRDYLDHIARGGFA